MTLTKTNLPKLVLKWYDYILNSEQIKTILKEVELACEEYGQIDSNELCEIIGDIIYQ